MSGDYSDTFSGSISIESTNLSTNNYFSFSGIDYAETRLTLSPSLLHFDYTEFSITDKDLVSYSTLALHYVQDDRLVSSILFF